MRSILSILVIFFLCIFQSTAFAYFIGKDDRVKISIDNTADSILASRIAAVQFCGTQSTGILTKIDGDDNDYMLISGQQLFNGIGKFKKFDSNKDGKHDEKDKRCNLKKFLAAKVAFNIHFKGTNLRRYAFKIERQLFDGPPINIDDAKNFWLTGETALLVKLKRKISEQFMPDTKRKRGAMRFLRPGEYNQKSFDKKTFTVAFDGVITRGIVKAEACAIRKFHTILDPRANYTSKCDAAPGASNSPMLININGEPAIWGIVVMGPKKNISDKAPFTNWTRVKSTEFLVKEYGLSIATGQHGNMVSQNHFNSTSK